MKVLVYGVLALLLLSFAFAENGQNFEKAAGAELECSEGILKLRKYDVLEHLESMSSDAVISGSEMKTLEMLITRFKETKEEFDKELEFFGKQTTTELPTYTIENDTISLDVLCNFYFDVTGFNLNCGDNFNKTIRRFFVERTGYDVRVEPTPDYWQKISLGLLVGIIGGLILAIFLTYLVTVDSFKIFFWTWGISFVLSMVLFLWIL